MINKIKSVRAEEVYAGLVRLIKTELSVDVQWLARITASPQTILELLLEITRYERCPKTRAYYQKIKIEERIKNYLQTIREMGEAERSKLSSTITCNKLFLVP